VLPARCRFACRIDAAGCPSCGGREFRDRPVLPEALVAAWGLTPRQRRWFDRREGNACAGCGQSKRVRMLAWSLARTVADLRSARVLQVNRINDLAPVLGAAGRLFTTGFGPAEWVPERGRPGVSAHDFEDLGFAPGSFDLVVHSETLEHLWDPGRALAESHRVLRPGGALLYTVPLLHGRRTRRRSRRRPDGGVEHLLPPSFHGLAGEYPVRWEFGGDFLRGRRRFVARIDYDDAAANPTVFTVVEVGS
jgi:SAM-dependent methyltransferase